MNLMKHLVICLGSLLLLVGCDTPNADNEHNLSLLDGNNFALKIDRIMSGRPDVQFPTDNLKESDYEESKDGTQYNVTFSKDGQMVTIEPGSISGQKTNGGDVSVLYELNEGASAGGRFVVWINNDSFEVELTLYGSGIPIVRSERGYMMIEQ